SLLVAMQRRGAEQEMEVSPGELAHHNLGLAFRAKGYYNEALREYRLALEKNEDRELVMQAMAEVYLLKRDAPAAVQLYERLVTEQSKSPKLWNEHGIALHQSGRASDAVESYRRAVNADPHYALALNNLGVALHHTGDASGARDAFERALGERPSFVK